MPPKRKPSTKLSHDDIEAMLNRAVEKGVAKALTDIGLSNEESVKVDIRDLRSLLHALNTAKRTAWQTIVRLLTTAMLLAMMGSIAVKLKLFGGDAGC